MNCTTASYTEYSPVYEAQEDEFQWVVRLTRDFLNETLTFTLLASTFGGTGEDGAFQRFSAEYDITDSLQIAGGVVLYKSGDLARFRNIGDNDRLFCQIKYSYMDVDHHPGFGGIRLAAVKGLAVVISEPLKSGRIVGKLPDSVEKVWGDALRERSLAEWGLRWVWHHPEIATAVSDMNTLEQLKENIALADVAAPDSLNVSEQLLVNRVRDAYQALKPVTCTACRGCMPCPQNIDVPRIFELYNDAVIYGDVETARSIYREEGHNIDDCNECGLCESACGRNIAICDWLKSARQLFNA